MTKSYRFDDARQAVTMLRHDLPSPWINYLSNGSLHAFVSQAGGGLCWWRSPLSFRLTRYRMYNLPLDSPGFYVYLRQPDGTCWSPTFRPCETALDAWTATHRPGHTRFSARKDRLAAELEFFVAPDYDVLVWDLVLTNERDVPVTLDVFGYVELSLLAWHEEVDWGCYVRHNLHTWFDEGLAAELYLYHHNGHPRVADIPLVCFAGTRPVVSYAGDRDDFVGSYRTERNPVAIDRNDCGNSRLECGEPCAALQHAVSIAPGACERLCFFLGTAPGALAGLDAARGRMADTLAALRRPGAVDAQREKLDAWWSEHLGRCSCRIPEADAQRQINVWTPVQCVHTARYSRAISTSASGIRGVGFRDTCQDMLAIAGRQPEWADAALCGLLAHQFRDGHAVHTFFPEEGQRPWTSVHCDDHLWLPLLAHAIAAETGDLALFDRRVSYLAGDAVGQDGDGTVWEHLMATAAFTESHLGQHGIPLILRSDWNDIIGKFGRKQRGESLFAAQQYVFALRLLCELAGALGRAEDLAFLDASLERQMKAIDACAWDGRWWRRGFDDDGHPFGTHDAPFGKIWLNTQSWAVLSGCGTPAQQSMAMDAVQEMLDTEMGLVKLTPSFPTYPQDPDPFSGYSPGCGENGAIFCHANTWAIMAEALLGNAGRAWKYYRQLIPHVACRQAGEQRYQGEPYAYASNIVGPENHRFGWANNTQVTGTAAWMDVAANQYLLGIRPELAGLRIDPCIPREWPGFSVCRRYRGCRLHIDVVNAGVEKGVTAVAVDGVPLPAEALPTIPQSLLAGRSESRIEVTMAG